MKAKILLILFLFSFGCGTLSKVPQDTNPVIIDNGPTNGVSDLDWLENE